MDIGYLLTKVCTMRYIFDSFNIQSADFQSDPVKLLMRLRAVEAHDGIAVTSISVGPKAKRLTKQEQVSFAPLGRTISVPYRFNS